MAHVEFCSLCGEAIARECVSGNTSPRTLTTNVSVPCGEEKRVCHLLVHLGTLTSTTRTLGDLLTLLCLFLINIILHTLIHKYQSYDTFQEFPHTSRNQIACLQRKNPTTHTPWNERAEEDKCDKNTSYRPPKTSRMQATSRIHGLDNQPSLAIGATVWRGLRRSQSEPLPALLFLQHEDVLQVIPHPYDLAAA